jgi:hypothetical protein
MMLTKTSERISFFLFFIILLLSSLSTLIIFLSFINSFITVDVLAKAIVAIPLCWFLGIMTISSAFRFANVVNEKQLNRLVNSTIYYPLVFLTMGLLPTYVFYAYLMCHRQRTNMFSLSTEPLNKIFGLIPIVNSIVMFKIARARISFKESTKLYFSFSLAKYIYLNFKTSTDIFN